LPLEIKAGEEIRDPKLEPVREAPPYVRNYSRRSPEKAI
jgi:hypothetical protein